MSMWGVAGWIPRAVVMGWALFPAAAAAQPETDAIELGDSEADTTAKLGNNVAVAKAAATALLSSADKKPPKNLSAEQREGYGKQSAFFRKAAGQLKAHAAKGEALLAKAKSQKSTLLEQMASMNVEFLALQGAIQMESRAFQTLSNASRARHDIAMNAIRNMKA